MRERDNENSWGEVLLHFMYKYTLIKTTVGNVSCDTVGKWFKTFIQLVILNFNQLHVFLNLSNTFVKALWNSQIFIDRFNKLLLKLP